MSLTAMYLQESARTKCLESRIHTSLGSGGRNESNSHELARIGEKNIFHELDVDHALKVGIKRVWPKAAEMSLTEMYFQESARRKFFINSTYIMSRKKEPNVFGLRRTK